ncbi:MAG: STAS/SEC14 domain-containing protein [Gammaproteobacteria bacterium]|nr:STAS/SEC14 domain-containing protein [Gammaproteobacteria bacterium]
MLELMEGMPASTLALRGSERVTAEDFQDVLATKTIQAKLSGSDELHLLLQLTPDFRRFTTTALWDNPIIGLHHLHRFTQVAIVTDIGWIRKAAENINDASATEIRTWSNNQISDAIEWITQYP